jgi:hypothetical protein
VFDIDLEHCPHCGGPLTIIAANEDPPVIVRILTHLGAGGRLVGGVGFFAQGQRTVYKDLRTRCGTSDELAALIGFVRATPGIAWRATESVSLACGGRARRAEEEAMRRPGRQRGRRRLPRAQTSVAEAPRQAIRRQRPAPAEDARDQHAVDGAAPRIAAAYGQEWQRLWQEVDECQKRY